MMSFTFRFPNLDDMSDIEVKDMVAKLADPLKKGGRYLISPLDFRPYDNALS